MHRGFEDSLDLLKVIIAAGLSKKEDQTELIHLESVIHKHGLEDWFFSKILLSEPEQLWELANQIEFDPSESIELARSLGAVSRDDVETGKTNFSLEFSGKNIADIWRDEEQLQNCFPGYRHRQSQEDLSLKVGQCLKNDVHVMVQAPTGTGKTLGYLIPSAIFFIERKAPASHCNGNQNAPATGKK